jgi:hypothetical protein
MSSAFLNSKALCATCLGRCRGFTPPSGEISSPLQDQIDPQLSAGFHQSPSRLKKDPSPALLRRAPSPLGEGCDFDFYPSPLGRGGTARRWVRGLFAGDEYMAVDVCGTRGCDGTLHLSGFRHALQAPGVYTGCASGWRSRHGASNPA